MLSVISEAQLQANDQQPLHREEQDEEGGDGQIVVVVEGKLPEVEHQIVGWIDEVEELKF
jgi:hypothetical protein